MKYVYRAWLYRKTPATTTTTPLADIIDIALPKYLKGILLQDEQQEFT